MFAQEFFLYCYSLFNQDRKEFMESSEGMTYMRSKHHDKCAVPIITTIKGPSGDPQKWQLKVRRLN
jgi:hypothetical protein